MPHHSMTLSRHQDKLLQTPATLETLGSTSAVPLHRLEAWKAACVNSWIHRHGPACGKEFVSELSCRNHACRTTAEQRQLSLLASCRFQDKPIGNYLPQTRKKTEVGSKLEAKICSKMKPFLASPNENNRSGLPEIETKNDFRRKRHKLSKPKRNAAAPKKRSPNECARQPLLQMLRTTEVYVSIKFHSSTSEARDSLHASSCQNQRSYTVFFYIMLALKRYSH